MDNMTKLSIVFVAASSLGVLLIIPQGNTTSSPDSSPLPETATKQQGQKETSTDETSQRVLSEETKRFKRLALQNDTVANILEKGNWQPHCCGSGSDGISIYFLDSENLRQLTVMFDRNTLEIIDLEHDETTRFGNPPSRDYPYEVIGTAEMGGIDEYFYKVDDAKDIPYLNNIYENNATLVTSEQYDNLREFFPRKCIENSPRTAKDCNDTPPQFEHNSKKFFIWSHGVENKSQGREYIQSINNN